MDVLKERVIEVATLCACVCMSQAKPNGIVGLEYFKNPKVLISKRHPVSLSANCLGAVWGKTFLYFRYFMAPTSGLALPPTIKVPKVLKRKNRYNKKQSNFHCKL